MPKRLPDELFRDSGATESADVQQDGATEAPHRKPPLLFRVREAKEVAPPLVVAGVVGALLLGFGVGKLVVAQSDTSMPEVSAGVPTASNSAPPSSESTLGPWPGPVQNIPVVEANGRCLDSISLDPPSNLLDNDPKSVWSCRGSGAGETITFTIASGEVVAGVRLINGNTIRPERYLAERRILSVQWTFSDGSWFVQGLSANNPEPQEVRFPPTRIAGDVTLTVLDATPPGETSDTNDSVSISSLEFLGVA